MAGPQEQEELVVEEVEVLGVELARLLAADGVPL